MLKTRKFSRKFCVCWFQLTGLPTIIFRVWLSWNSHFGMASSCCFSHTHTFSALQVQTQLTPKVSITPLGWDQQPWVRCEHRHPQGHCGPGPPWTVALTPEPSTRWEVGAGASGCLATAELRPAFLGEERPRESPHFHF